MFKNVVAAVDGSECSDAALEVAIALASGENARLTLCTVADPSQILAEHTEPVVPFDSWAERLGAIAAEINARSRSVVHERGVPCEHVILPFAPAAKALVDYAEHYGVDCIVMGTHGRSGLVRALSGSVAQGVMGRARCTVVMVRAPKAVPAPAPSP
ncbi:MAG TPA: universal stress protein [Candidatus Baltobacteraceae bacterium]|jgi:nucleotide-binding universal stress UspA family protein